MSLRFVLSALLALSLAMLPIAGAGAKARDAGRPVVDATTAMMHGVDAGHADAAHDHAAAAAHDHGSAGDGAGEHGEHGHTTPYDCGSTCCDMSCHALSVAAFPELASPQAATLLRAWTTPEGMIDNRHIRLDRPPKTT